MLSNKTLSQFEMTTKEILKLKKLPGKEIIKPISEGKWSIREIIIHLFYWDKYILDVMIPNISNGANLPDFPDHDTHNQEGINYIKDYKSNESIFDLFENTRSRIIDEFSSIDNGTGFTIGKGKRQFSPEEFIKIFLHHDNHHLEQISSFINTSKE